MENIKFYEKLKKTGHKSGKKLKWIQRLAFNTRWIIITIDHPSVTS